MTIFSEKVPHLTAKYIFFRMVIKIIFKIIWGFFQNAFQINSIFEQNLIVWFFDNFWSYQIPYFLRSSQKLTLDCLLISVFLPFLHDVIIKLFCFDLQNYIMHSVLERNWIKGSYLSQLLPQDERGPPKESKSWWIEIIHGGSQ